MAFSTDWPSPGLRRTYWIFTAILLGFAVLAVLDNWLGTESLLFEAAFSLAVLNVLASTIQTQHRYPEITQYGWQKIIWGCGFLLLGSLVDILDDPNSIHALNTLGIPITRTWYMAFAEKLLGFTLGFGLIAFGFFQWVPWMIETRLNVSRLNQRLAGANQNLSRILMSLDEHIESVRLHISRELHDDVAQQLTSLGFQLQLCQKDLDQEPDAARERIKAIGREISDVLKSVRQISRDLRPEALYALGMVPALEQFLDKMRSQNPDTELTLDVQPLENEEERVRIEALLNDQNLLHLYRILQEGVRNALKHAQAKHIRIIIQEEPHQFRFQVEDDGLGLPWTEIPADERLIQEGHLGIAGLRERVREISGTFALSQRPEGGARMEVCLAK